jgi:hypothetical protein
MLFAGELPSPYAKQKVSGCHIKSAVPAVGTGLLPPGASRRRPIPCKDVRPSPSGALYRLGTSWFFFLFPASREKEEKNTCAIRVPVIRCLYRKEAFAFAVKNPAGPGAREKCCQKEGACYSQTGVIFG